MSGTTLRGRTLFLAVVFSTAVFLILHSTELPFQEYGNLPMLTFFRLLILVPLLIFLYRGFHWARITLAVLCLILLTAGVLGFILIGAPWMTPTNMLFIGVMMVCLTFNVTVLLFSGSLKAWLRAQRSGPIDRRFDSR
jgi:ABC-type uncharacterized transport system permease subunit